MRLPLIAALLLATPAAADISVRFSEGAPKDRFTFTADVACLNGPISVRLDLSGSASGLIFDVTESGAGVEVFQPFELVAGGDLVTTPPQVKDGDTELTLGLSQLPKGGQVAFTIDLDDTTGGREITVNGSEIAGAAVHVTWKDGSAKGVFGENARALVKTGACAT